MKMNRRATRVAVLAAIAVVLVLLPKVPAYAADARNAYLDGVAAQGVEDYPLAVEKFKEALSLNPAYLEPMVGLAASFFQMEEYDEASTWISRAHARRGTSSRIRQTCGWKKRSPIPAPDSDDRFHEPISEQSMKISHALPIGPGKISMYFPNVLTHCDPISQAFQVPNAPIDFRRVCHGTGGRRESNDVALAKSLRLESCHESVRRYILMLRKSKKVTIVLILPVP